MTKQRRNKDFRFNQNVICNSKHLHFVFPLMGATKSDTLEHFKALADTVSQITLSLNVTQAYRHHSQCLPLSSRGGKHGAGGRRPHMTTDAGNEESSVLGVGALLGGRRAFFFFFTGRDVSPPAWTTGGVRDVRCVSLARGRVCALANRTKDFTNARARQNSVPVIPAFLTFLPASFQSARGSPLQSCDITRGVPSAASPLSHKPTHIWK